MTPYYQDSAVTIYHGDAYELLPQIPTPDLLLTDPPYGADYGAKNEMLNRLDKGNRIQKEIA